jgi:RNase P subunit RPR2
MNLKEMLSGENWENLNKFWADTADRGMQQPQIILGYEQYDRIQKALEITALVCPKCKEHLCKATTVEASVYLNMPHNEATCLECRKYKPPK